MAHLLSSIVSACLVIQILFLSNLSHAAPPSAAGGMTVSIPPALEPWRDWVLLGHEEVFCPILPEEDDTLSRCQWPAHLSLTLDQKGGSFTLAARLFSQGFLPLPGSHERWPQEVRHNNQLSIPIAHKDKPALFLPAGEHTITGRFFWDSLPDALAIPPSYAVVNLRLRDRAIEAPNRDQQGMLWLSDGSTDDEASTMNVQVVRLLEDTVPATLETRLVLRVSGKSREETLGPVLLPHFLPVSLNSTLPTELDSEGRLRVRVRAGDYTITFISRHEGPVTQITLPSATPTWPSEEVWAFVAHPELRTVSLENVPSIDARQTALPNKWQNFPVYLVMPEKSITLRVESRGDERREAESLSLMRELWLDFDGKGYTVEDTIKGKMTEAGRLEMAPPTLLGRVALDGNDRLITEGKSTLAGVQYRAGSLQLKAISRIPQAGIMVPAVSWQRDFSRVQTSLKVPPGYRPFLVTGADDVQDTWFAEWTFWHLFFALVVCAAMFRLRGKWALLLAIPAMLLTATEPSAPRFSWLVFLAFEALVLVVPGKARIWCGRARAIAFLVLAYFAVTFVIKDIRMGLHPALGEKSYAYDSYEDDYRSSAYAEISAERPERVASKEVSDKKGKIQMQIQARANMDIDPNAAVQTGPGKPTWSWGQVDIQFTGPVEAERTLGIYWLPPWANCLLAFLRLFLLAGLMGWVVPLTRGVLRQFGEVAAPALTFFLPVTLIAMLGAMPRIAQAQMFPDAQMLNELQQRLITEPACSPDCATIPRLFLEATPSLLRLRLEVVAAAETAIPLPGQANQWLPRSILVDGRPATAMQRDQDTFIWLALSKGVHQVLMEGPLFARETTQLALPLSPKRVEARMVGMRLDGLHEDGLADDSLQLSPTERGESKTTKLETALFAPFAMVERTIQLDLTWQVETRVVRLTPPGVAFSLEVPLLPGEALTTGNMRVENGKAQIQLPAAATEVTYRSTLAIVPSLRLTAANTNTFVEVWQLDASTLFHIESQELAPIFSSDGHLPTWRPWPGESVVFLIERPKAAKGELVTVDESTLVVSPGSHAIEMTLKAKFRASQGGSQILTLPHQASVSEVTINGIKQPVRQIENLLTVVLPPAESNITITLRTLEGISTFFTVPALRLGIPSSNAKVQVSVPTNRWVLWTHGPRLGPSVLFWSLFIVLVFVSFALGRVRWAPLSTWQWFLLWLGLSQVSLVVGLFVVLWLIALGYRQKHPEVRSHGLFNLRQVVLVGWSLWAMGALFYAIAKGLLGQPAMQVRGNHSDAYDLNWFLDRATETLPTPFVFSVPLWLYRAAMLAWALWLALALLRWLRFGWKAFTTDGVWHKPPAPPPKEATPPPQTPATPI